MVACWHALKKLPRKRKPYRAVAVAVPLLMDADVHLPVACGHPPNSGGARGQGVGVPPPPLPPSGPGAEDEEEVELEPEQDQPELEQPPPPPPNLVDVMALQA
jgi:hypothetical protein